MEPEKRSIEIEGISLRHLKRTGKWSMFIAIVGFIVLGVIIIAGIMAGTFLASFNAEKTGADIPDEVLMAIIVATGIIYIFPVFFLVRFSKHISNAVRLYDKTELRKAIKSLMLYFVYIGILLIVLISGYLAALIISGRSVSFV